MIGQVLLQQLVLVALSYIVLSKSEDVSEVLEVICPPFEGDYVTKSTLYMSRVKDTNNDYCQCSITQHGISKTAKIMCDFNNEKDVVLKGNVFPFKEQSITSAYVRMQNARSVKITSEFLSTWMDSPSSALDIWHCAYVNIEPTPLPTEKQLFSKLKSFVGVGIIDSIVDTLPTYFLRDRSRGALRLKECSVERISGGIFHNIEEVRYMNFEDTIVEEVAGPLSSSGVITLSKKEIHAWDGIKFINSTFKHIAPFSFNVTHKDVMETFVVIESNFGSLEEGGISATGDIDVTVSNSSFSKLDSMAIQVSVSGQLSFSHNTIEDYETDSLYGLKCKKDSNLNNNIFYVYEVKPGSNSSEFLDQCGKPKVSHIVLPSQKSEALHSVTTASVVSSTIFIVLLLTGGLLIWAYKNRTLFRYHYRRNDIPLCREDKPDGLEDPAPLTDSSSSSLNHPPTYMEQKVY